MTVQSDGWRPASIIQAGDADAATVVRVRQLRKAPVVINGELSVGCYWRLCGLVGELCGGNDGDGHQIFKMLQNLTQLSRWLITRSAGSENLERSERSEKSEKQGIRRICR